MLKRPAMIITSAWRGVARKASEPKLQFLVRCRLRARGDHETGLERPEKKRRPCRARAEEHDHAVARHQPARPEERGPAAGGACDVFERALFDHALGIDEPKRPTVGVGRERLHHVAGEVERRWCVRTGGFVRARRCYVSAADKPSHCLR